jgi:hypothetical protein
MPLTNAGRDAMASRLINDATTVEFDNANAKIGVGDSNAAFDVVQTDLQAAVNKLRKGMDATFPTIAGNALTFKSTFIGGEANWAWQEWAVFNAQAGSTMLNRVVEYNGTKLAGQTWILQVTLTVNIGV